MKQKKKKYNPLIQEYGKIELAQLYFPDVKPETARHRLRSWIIRCSKLSKELENLGYHKRSLHYSRRQVAAIFDYLGEP